MNNIVQKQKKHLTGKLLALLMFLFAFTGVTRANVQQNRADQVIEQGFEDGLGDWTMNHCHSSSGPTSSYGGNTGNYAFRFYYTANYPQYLISPEFDEENGGGNITFYAAIYSGNYPETYKVGYSFTTNDPSEFTWYDEVTCTTIYTGYDEVSYDLPAGVKFVSIACTSNDMFYLFVDDITVTLEEPAPAPTPGEIVEVTIGDPTSTTTNSYLPGYTLYDYAISQQIYTADEIGVAGTINTLTMWLKNSSSYARNINVYMAEIEASEFTSNSDWVSMTADNMVASFTMQNGITEPVEMALDLSNPFNYSGSGNLVICFQDVTGQWSNGLGGVVMDAAGSQAIYAYRDGTSYDVSNPGVNGTLLAKKNVVRLAIMTGGGAGPAIVANPETIDLGFRPNGYWMEPVIFELYNQGSEGIVTAVESADPFFTVDVEVPYTLARHESLFGTITTGTADNVGEINTQLTVLYEGEGLEDQDTTYVDVTVTAYQAVTPDVWELAEEVTEFPFQTTTTTADLYKNYNLLGMNDMAKDAVYKVTFDNDVLFSASVSGEDAVAYIYEEGFNDFGGPSYDNYYEYDGPQVNPGPLNYWFSYAYTGTNTFFGTSTGGGMYFGYRITPAQLQELGLGNCAIITVEAAARNSDAATFYDLAIMKGGDEPNFDNIVYYQGFSDFTPGYFFDINLNEPQLMGDDENIWIMLYSDSPYAAYCGKTPVDTENGKIWYTTDMSTWYSSTNYTPMIYCQFLEIPTGRTVNMNLANMEIKSNPNATAGQLGEAAGAVNGVSKAQRYMEAKAQYSRGNRDGETYQIENLYVPAGTYYVVVSSTSEDFDVNMMIDEVPNPEQAVVYTPYEGETNVASPYYAEWSLGYYNKEMQVLCGTENPPVTALIDWTDYLVEAAFMTSLDNNRTYYFQVNERNDTGVTEGEIISFTTPFDMVQGFEAVSPYIYVGDVAEFTWNAIEDEELLGYNIYLSGEKLNESIITETSYTYEGLEYNPYGYSFFVEAVYEGGISNRIGATVFVSGYGNVDGHVYEQDGVTPIAGVNLYFYGYDDYGVYRIFNAVTDEEGHYNKDLMSGVYLRYWAVKSGYQTAYNDEMIDLAYQDTVEGVDFILDEEYYGVDYVDAIEELPYPKVEWGDYILKADFEEGIPEGWTMIDADGDGYNWSLKSNGGHESDQSVISASWIYGVGAVSPDNYLVTPQIPLGGKLSFWARTNDANYSAEHFGLAVSTGSNDNPEDFTMLQEWTMTAKRGGDSADRNNMNRGTRGYEGEWYEYEVDLSAYEGQNGYVAIRHFNTYDMFELNVDDVIVDNRNYTGDRSFEKYRIYRTAYDNVGPYNTENTTLVGEIISGSFIYDESFDEVEEGLYKYGVSVVYEGNRDGALNEFTETFDEGLPENWTMIDADYDGRCWMLGSEASLGFGHGHNGSNDMMISKSFENGSSVYPDNYLVTPLVQFGNQSRFEFYACAQDANYPEYVGVAVSTSGNEYAYDFATIAEWQVDNERSQGIWHKYVVELDQYAGQTGYIAIRHFNSSYNFYLDIDDVKFYDIDIQGARESAIRWSETYVGKDMYLTDGAVNISVTLASGDAPEGIVATFKNLTQPEIEDIVVELDENGYYSFDSFRKGEYEVTLTKADYYDEVGTYYIMEPTSIEFMMYELLYAPRNLKVSHTGYATWDAPQSPDRHLVDDMYNIYLYDANDGSMLWYTTVYDNYMYLPEDMLSDGVMYITQVRAYYSANGGGLYPSELTSCTWTYRSCDHYVGANNLKAKPLDEGVYMTWDYPVVDTVQVLGANVYVNYEYVGFTEGNEWLYEGYGEYNSFSIRVVYDNYDMSCMQYAEMINRYRIYTYNYDGGGYIIGGGVYYEGDTCVLAAFPYDDYDFYCWNNDWYGGIVSYEPTYSFVVTEECGYAVKFITDHYWNDVNLYENNMGVIGIVKIEDEEVDGVDAPLVEIGAFCNGECRGHQRLHYYPQVDRYLVYLTVYGNEGDDINFHLSINGIEQSMMCTTTVVFEADAVVGTPFEPYEFNFYGTFWNEQYDEFNTGWNWWSTYIEQGGNYNGLTDLQAYLTNSGYMISSQTEFTMNYGSYGWYGSLNKIDNESMYKIKMNEPGYSYLYYYNARTDRHPITVVPGWNYIGYVCNYNMDLEDALVGLEPSNGDMIKSQYAYANYYEGYGWFGSLNYMEPGMGYMYKAADTATFVYGEVTRGITKENLTAENNHWMPNTNAYRDNMTVMAVVNLNDVEVNSDNYELAAFADGECRGSVRLTYAEPLNRYVVFLTVAGEETASLSFGLYDAQTGAECYSDNNIEFNSDIVVGNPGKPVVISFKGMNDNNGFMVYPNPVANGERVNIVLPSDTQRAQVEVLNSLGEVVSVETLTQSQSSIALPKVPGVYTVRIITDNKDANFRKVIVK